MNQMRGEFFAEICGAMLCVVKVKRREIGCMVRKEIPKRNILVENHESDLPWLKCCFSKFVS